MATSAAALVAAWTTQTMAKVARVEKGKNPHIDWLLGPISIMVAEVQKMAARGDDEHAMEVYINTYHQQVAEELHIAVKPPPHPILGPSNSLVLSAPAQEAFRFLKEACRLHAPTFYKNQLFGRMFVYETGCHSYSTTQVFVYHHVEFLHDCCGHKKGDTVPELTLVMERGVLLCCGREYALTTVGLGQVLGG
jgi:hypothetical protein